jgi:hypothetical protein
MSLDGLVLVIAIFAVALKLYLWFSEEGVVRGMLSRVGPICCTLMTTDRVSRWKRGQTELRVVPTPLRPRLKGDRYV